MRPQAHEVRDHARDAHGREQQPEEAERAEQHRVEPRGRRRLPDALAHARHAVQRQ